MSYIRNPLRRARALRLVCGLLAAGVLLIHAPGAAVADDDDDDLTFEQRIIKNLLSGVGAQTGSGIDYRERSPLVVPPSRDLPPPEAAALDQNSAWPKDPEARVRAAKKKKQDRPRTVREQQLYDDPGRPLLPSELDNPGVKPRNSQRVTRVGQSPDEFQQGRPLRPSELGVSKSVFGSIFESKSRDETGTFDGEGPRTSLTAPPPGYQTPSTSQPYGLRENKSWWQKIPSPFDRGTQSN